jgi:hypothetical protein
MPVLPRERFAERVGELSAADLRSFVADLWRASGYDVREEEETLVATRRGGRVRLFPSVGRRLRGPTRPPDGTDPDVIVDGSGRAHPLAEECGAERVSPSDLYDRLLYGLDRETAARLLDRHLDAALHVDAETAAAYDDRCDPTGAGDGDGESGSGSVAAAIERLRPDGGDAATLVAVGAVLFAAVALGVGPGSIPELTDVGGPVAFDAGDGPVGGDADAGGAGGGGAGAGSGGNGSGTAGAASVGAIGASPNHPPGIDPEGERIDVSVLAEAHAEFLDGRSYRWEGALNRSVDAGEGEWDDARWTEIVESDVRYLKNASAVQEYDNGTALRSSYAVYSDGTVRYRRVDWGNRPVRYQRTPPEALSGTQALWGIRRYLGGDNVSVTRLGTGEPTLYRVTVREPPGDDREFRRASDYRVVAHVTARGFVLRLHVEYDLVKDGRAGSVRYRSEYSRIGTASVPEPGWLDDARARTVGRVDDAPANATGTAGTGSESAERTPNDGTATETTPTGEGEGSRNPTARTPADADRPLLRAPALGPRRDGVGSVDLRLDERRDRG